MGILVNPLILFSDGPSRCACRESGRSRDGRLLAVFIVEDGQMAGFIVEVIEYAGTLNQVAGFVVGVAAVEYGTTKVV